MTYFRLQRIQVSTNWDFMPSGFKSKRFRLYSVNEIILLKTLWIVCLFHELNDLSRLLVSINVQVGKFTSREIKRTCWNFREYNCSNWFWEWLWTAAESFVAISISTNAFVAKLIRWYGYGMMFKLFHLVEWLGLEGKLYIESHVLCNMMLSNVMWYTRFVCVEIIFQHSSTRNNAHCLLVILDIFSSKNPTDNFEMCHQTSFIHASLYSSLLVQKENPRMLI